VPVVELTDSEFVARIVAHPVALVDFHAGWSAPCVVFKPIFKRLAADYPGVPFFLIDIEAHPGVNRLYPIGDLPFLGVFRDGELTEGYSTSDEGRFRSFLNRTFGRVS
jgi:thioredoxin 1